MFPKPTIKTIDRDNEIEVRVRHETPEGARMMESLGDSTQMGTFLVISTAGILWLLFSTAIGADAGFVVGIAVLVIVAFWASRVLEVYLYKRRFFLLRRLAERTLQVTLARPAVMVAGQSYQRGSVVRFSCAPHRWGRHEERQERVKERLIPMTYRLGWQVWLQHGEEFILLADVSDEDGAKAITRALQAADERVTRGTFAESEDAPFGERQVID